MGARPEELKPPATATVNSASAAKRRASVAEASTAIFEAYGKIKAKREIAKKEKAETKKAEKKAEKEAAVAAKAKEVKGKAKAKPKPKCEKARDEPKAKAEREVKCKEEPKPSTDPSFSHEASRSQFLARTGIRGPGNSQRFPYSAGSKTSMQDAKAEATKFVVNACKTRRIEVPERYAV